MALDPGGASGAAGYRPPPRVPRIPSPHQPNAGGSDRPSWQNLAPLTSQIVGQQTMPSLDYINSLPQAQPYSGTPSPRSWKPSQAEVMANAMMMQLQPTIAGMKKGANLNEMAAGFRDSFDPRNIPDIPSNLWYAANHPMEAIEAMGTDRGKGGLLAGAATAGVTGGSSALLPFAKSFKIPKSASPSKRVLDYPTMDSSIWRIKNQKMGEHYGFGGRLGDPNDRAKVEQQRAAPSVEEHLAALDRAAAQQGGIPPALDRILNKPFRPNELDNMFQYNARSRDSRPVGRDDAMFSLLAQSIGPPTLSKGQGMHLGRELGELDDQFDPVSDAMSAPPAWQQHGVQLPDNLIKRQGLNQARRSGSFMDESRGMTPEMLANMLQRSGMWRAQ